MTRKLNYKGTGPNVFSFLEKNSINKTKNKRTKIMYYSSFLSNFNDTSPKNLIVIYDITEEMKKERDWFRRHLKKFNYVMIQRSVWVGPSPLPNDFIDYVKSIGLMNQLKTFKLAKPYSEKDNHDLR